jgi:ankyrin repeat protein
MGNNTATAVDESYKSIYVTITPEEYDAGVQRSQRALLRSASVDELLVDSDSGLDHIKRVLHRSSSLDELLLASDMVPWYNVVDGAQSLAIIEKLHDANKKGARSSQRGEKSSRKKMDPNTQLKIHFYKLLNIRDPASGCSGFNVSKVNKMMDDVPSLSTDTFLFTAFPQPVTALHMLCAMDAPLSCIKRCLSYNRDAIHDTSSTLGSPIHYACYYNANIKIIRFICGKFLDTMDTVLCKTNRAKRTPLHLACMMMLQHDTDASTELVELLTSACSIATSVVDKDGMTPLHYAVSHQQPTLAIIEDLTEVGPNAGIIQTTETRSTPLHLALRNPATNSAMVQDLIVSCTQVLQIQDKDGNTPLHVAVEEQRSVTEIKLMLKLYPQAMNKKNQKGKVPYKLAKSVARKSNVDNDDIVQLLRSISLV